MSGSILVFVERMDDEFTKILLNTDAHSTLYVERSVTMVTILVDHVTTQITR